MGGPKLQTRVNGLSQKKNLETAVRSIRSLF